MRRLARSLVRDAGRAEDVAQDVMAAALQQPEPPGSWRSWLATVTRRLAGKSHRRHRLRASHERPLEEEPGGDSERRTQERLELHRRLTDAVLELPEPYRTAVTLRHLDGLPPRGIARRLGWSVDATRQRLSRGLSLLRERLDRDYGSRRAWLGAFAGLGLGGVTIPWTAIALLTMNKFALAAGTLVAAGTIWIVADRRTEAPPVPEATATTTASKPVAVAPRDGAQAPERAPLPTPSACTVRVCDLAGRPLAAAEVLCWSEGEDPVRATADERGVATFAARGPGSLLVRHPTHVPAHLAVEEREGAHVLRLDGGHACAGVLLVDGQPAPIGTQLRVRGEGQHVLDSVPTALAAELRWRGPATIETGPNGAFVLAGLPADARPTLELPRHLWLLPESGGRMEGYSITTLALDRNDHVVRTTRLPTVEGTVVWDDDGTPVPGANLLAFATFADGGNTPSIGARADERGRFVVPLIPSNPNRYVLWTRPEQRPDVLRVDLGANADGSERDVRLTIDRERYARGPVTMRLVRAPQMHFVAVDENDRPIRDAVVVVRSAGTPTDEQGRGTFRGRLDDGALVGAPDHRLGPLAPRAAAAGTLEDPHVFVLPPDNVVTVRLLGPDGALPDVASVILQADRAPFAGGRWAGKLDDRLHDAAIDGQTASGDRGYRAWLRMPTGGQTLTLRSLEPGVQLRVVLVDDLGSEVAGESFVAPAFGARAELTVRSSSRAFYVTGVVRDERLAPVARAEVELRARAADGTWLSHRDHRVAIASARTDDAGAFRIGPLHTPLPGRLSVKAAGFAPCTRELAAGQLAEPQDLALQRGRQVTVQVVDDAGEPVPLGVAVRGVECENQRAGPSTTRFDDLPPGEVEFTAIVGRTEFRLVHDTDTPTATLRVPRPGRLVVQPANGWPTIAEDQYFQAVVQPIDPPGETIRVWRPDRDGAPPELLLPGRYRVSLEVLGGPDATPLPIGAEVDVRAGSPTTAVLR